MVTTSKYSSTFVGAHSQPTTKFDKPWNFWTGKIHLWGVSVIRNSTEQIPELSHRIVQFCPKHPIICFQRNAAMVVRNQKVDTWVRGRKRKERRTWGPGGDWRTRMNEEWDRGTDLNLVLEPFLMIQILGWFFFYIPYPGFWVVPLWSKIPKIINKSHQAGILSVTFSLCHVFS